MQIELKSIQQKTGKTFIFVTHDQEEALTMSDVIVVMNKGRIEQMGGPDELYARPRSRFVADFIGQSNFLEGAVVSVSDGIAAVEWRGNVVHADVNGTSPVPGERATLALRPEALYCLSSKPEGRPALKGRVDQRVFKGAHTTLTVALENGSSLLVQIDPVALSHIEGDDVWVGWRDRDAVLLAN
ncbi:Spermidine/putrescine import ATP-binding protein PotA [compost metagenome]